MLQRKLTFLLGLGLTVNLGRKFHICFQLNYFGSYKKKTELLGKVYD